MSWVTVSIMSDSSTDTLTVLISVVFGLVHEHQRSDRDIFIDYRPENIAGYTDALNAALKDGVPEEEARKMLRDDNNFCLKYNFRGSAYVSKLFTSPLPRSPVYIPFTHHISRETHANVTKRAPAKPTSKVTPRKAPSTSTGTPL